MPHTFHDKLRPIESGHPLLHNSLAFICSVISHSRTPEQLTEDADIKALNWMFTYQTADNSFVLPLLYARIQQKSLATHCPDDFINALQVVHEANCNRNAHYRQVLIDTVGVLNEVGITPMLLKGAHALIGLLPDSQERLISDIDLIVPNEKILVAKQALLKAGFFQRKEDEFLPKIDEDVTYHQIMPLYHPEGGIVEIHRHPNFALRYPNLEKICFSPDTMCLVEQEGIRFYHNHPWQLLLYNQIHHYHDSLDSNGMTDLRQLAEQSSLLASIPQDGQLEKQIAVTLGNKTEVAQLQFALMAELFSDKIPTGLVPTLPTKTARHLDNILGMLLVNPDAQQQRKHMAARALVSYTLKRSTNMAFLKRQLNRNLPYKILSIIRRGQRLT